MARLCLKIRSAVILKDDRCLLDGLQALADSAFPKRCNNCGRTFDSVRDFIAETVSVHNGISGAKASRGDNEEVIVELYRNCVCGSTLMDFFSDRRDQSESGLKRRQQFADLQQYLVARGVPDEQARKALLAVLRGGRSELLQQYIQRKPANGG